MLIKYKHLHETHQTSRSRSSRTSSEAATPSTYSTASTSDTSFSDAQSSSPCPNPEDDQQLESDQLVAICNSENSVSLSPDAESSSSWSLADVNMHWQDNAAHMQLQQARSDTISKMKRRRKRKDEQDQRRLRRKEEKLGPSPSGQKEEKQFYDFMADVRSTTRITAPLKDWGCDNPDAWWVSVGYDRWKRDDPVKEETSGVPVPVADTIPNVTSAQASIAVVSSLPTNPHGDAKCKITPIPGKGLGVIATSKILQGQVIITESPFLIVDHPPNIHQVNSRLSKLPIELQQLFHTFNPSCSPLHSNRMVDIIATNVIPLGDDPIVDLEDDVLPLDADGEVEQRCRSGLFKTICRVNHSCQPNSRWTWYDSGIMVLRALRPIADEEEITACYLQDTAMVHEDRQQTLCETWGFICTCAICALPADRQTREDDRRTRFRKIRDEYIGLDKNDTWQGEGLLACSAKIKKAIKLLEEGGQEGEIADCRWLLFILSVRWGDEEKAKREGSAWLRQAMKMGDDPGQQYRGLVRKPRTAIEWGWYDDDRSGEESECDSDDDFETTYRQLRKVQLRVASVTSAKTVSRVSRRSRTVVGTRC